MNTKVEDETGASLFKGEPSIFVGVDDRQQEEEEELEDRKRRDQELQNLVANYFGNTTFDDDGSVVSTSFDSTNTSRFKDDTRNDAPDESEKYMEVAYKDSSLYGNDQWQILYQNAVREEKKLKEELEHVKINSKTEIDGVNRKYYLAEAESRRMKILLEQAQAIVEEKTEAVHIQEKQIGELSIKIKELEQTKQNLEDEVCLWKSSSNELEQKLHLMEKGLNSGVSEKQIRSHYDNEISKLQTALQTTNEKLEKFEKQSKELRDQIAELEYVRDTLISQREEYMKEIEKEREEHFRICLKIIQGLREIKKEVFENQDNSFTNSDFHDLSTRAIQEECQAFLTKFRQDLKIIYEKSNHEISNLREICDKLRKNEEVLKKELRSQRDIPSTKNYDHIISTLESELKRSIAEQAQKRSEIDKLEELVKEMRKNEEELKSEIRRRKKGKIKEKENESTDKYEEFLVKFRNDLKNSVDEQQALNNEIKILENRIVKLKEREENLKKKIGRKSHEGLTNENEKLKEKNEEISSLKSKIKYLHENEEALKKELKSFEPEKFHEKNNEIIKLNKIIIELHSMNERLKKDLKHLKTPYKGRHSLSKEILQENAHLKHKIQDLEGENKILSAELRENREKQKGNMDAVDIVVNNYVELEKGVQNRSKLAEKKLLEAQNIISLLQSQLAEKRAIEINLREQLATKSDKEEIVEDLVKKSVIFEEYMSNKKIKMQETGVQTDSIHAELNPNIKTENMCSKCTQTSVIKLSRSVQANVNVQKSNLHTVSSQTEPYETDSQVFNTILERRYKQLEGLLEENKNLKFKLQQDREAFNDLTNTWQEEMKHLNTALSEAFQSREDLIKRINELSIENQAKSDLNDALTNKLTCLNEILNKYEIAAADREKFFLQEHIKIKKFLNLVLETLLQKVTNCVMRTDYAIKTDL